jgi:integrase
MSYRAIETMNNTAWQTARRVAKLGDLHVHDLRHTVGMRLREAVYRRAPERMSYGTPIAR